MSGFVNPFVSGRYRWLAEFLIWVGVTLALLAVGAAFCFTQVHDSLRAEASAKLAHFDRLEVNVADAFAELKSTVTSEPCSDQFLRELRRVAFKPDGLNEFMYAPKRLVTCSTSLNSAQAGIPLGEPDIKKHGNSDISLWVNKRLDAVGLLGLTANVVYQEPFAIVVPPQAFWADRGSWAQKEYVVSAPDGRSWHLGGDTGIFSAADSASDDTRSTVRAKACGEHHAYCVAVKADMAEMAFNWRSELVVAMCLIAFYAIWPTSVACRALETHWSFSSRFRRHLNTPSIVCAYQPILDLRTGAISGCEVLARWRDVDGSIVPPDKFIDFVSKSGETLAFTKMVVDKAFDELTKALPQTAHLQINFNIFPRDLSREKLNDVFASFLGERSRFKLALEIVESDALALDEAQGEIEALARLGIRTYIDDFGSGYSSIHRVASLAIHGVKLDRSFAMAPSESLMARMLVHAVDMIGSSGREIVVEGVETQERLDLLIDTKAVGFVQGYLISRPLSIEGLVAFLAKHDPVLALASPEREAA